MATDRPAKRQPMFAIVRDKQGRPRFDNIYGIPREMWGLLTENEQEEIKRYGGYPAN